MRPLTRYFWIQLFYVTIDVACMVVSIFIASSMREGTLPFSVNIHNLFFEPNNPYRNILYFWIVVTIVVNHAHGLYRTKREIFESVEIFDVFRSVFFSSILTMVAFYLAKIQDFPRVIMIITIISTSILFSLWRILKRVFVRYLVSQGYNNFNAIIVGAGKVGTTLAHEIHHRSELGIKIVGYLDDFKTTEEVGNGIKVIGKISDFYKIAPKEFINKVFITIHHDSKAFLKLLEEAKELGIAVQVIPQGFELMASDYYKYNIGFIPIIEYSNVGNLKKHLGKRFFDLVLTIPAVLVLMPFFLMIAVLILLDSRGPVVYSSRRYGLGGRIFKMYKFRSMVQNAEKLLDELKHKNEVDGPIFKIKEDPRITKVGKILRKFSLDELPQLFNVLIGDMSLVGPRPLPIDQVEKEDLDQLRRLEVRPGITGLWQIRGRSDISFARLIKWDIWYINNWSFWLDVSILFQTIPVVIKGKGAY